MKIKQTAEYLRLSNYFVRGLIKSGQLKAEMVSGKGVHPYYDVTLEELNRFIDSKQEKGNVLKFGELKYLIKE